MKISLIVLLLVCTTSLAEHTEFELHLTSHHFDNSSEFEEDNYGIGVTRYYKDRWVFLPVDLTIPTMILRCILVWFIPITCAFQAHSPVQLVRLGVSLQGMEIMLMEREKCG